MSGNASGGPRARVAFETQLAIGKSDDHSGGPPARVAFETLGCKLNQYETEAIAGELSRRGYTVVDEGSAAEVYVINSCTVTNKADRKSRNALNRASRAVTGGTPLVVLTGCFAEESAGAQFDAGADTLYRVDNRRKPHIPDIIDAHLRGETIDPLTLDADAFAFAAPERIFRTRTNVKIQDGCDNFCTFCIIPFVRGRAVSRPLHAILEEVRSALAAGSREVVLTGVNLSRYLHEGHEFADVVAALLELDGDFRVRISSLEPDRLDERFIELFRHPKMCPHLHLCLQSGSERVLLAMRRMYTVHQYRHVVEQLREIDPLFNVTTDMIVGFPGESETEHAESVAAVGNLGFGHVHTFPYSRRRMTRADRMSGHVQSAVKTSRGQDIRLAAERSKRTYRESLIGKTERVLTERVSVEKLEVVTRRGNTTIVDGAVGGRDTVRGGDTAGSAAAGNGAADHTDRQSRLVHVGYGFGEHYVPIRFWSEQTLEANRFYAVRIMGVEAGEDPALLGELTTQQ